MNTTRQFCTFIVEGMFFGVPVLEVQEVLRHQQMTPVPLAPEMVRGLINLRGQIVTAIDMRSRLGLPASSSGEPPMNVIIRNEDGVPVSLLVDDIGDVLTVEDTLADTPPETLRGPARELVRTVYKLPGRLMLELNSGAAVSLPTSDLHGRNN